MSALRRLVPALALTTLALVACDQEGSTVTVYAPYEGGPVYPNNRPAIELPAGEVGITSNNGSDTLTVLDLAQGEVITTTPIGRSPVDQDGPHHLAIDPAGFVYVALAYPPLTFLPGPHSVHGSSLRSGFLQKLALDDLRLLGEVRVENNPGEVVLSEDNTRIVVSHYDLARALDNPGEPDKQRANVAVIDADLSQTRLISTCVAPHGAALSRPDGAVAFVACYGEDAIAIVDIASESVERILVGAGGGVIGAPTYGPYSAVLSPAGDRVALGNLESRDLRFFDVASSSMEALVASTEGSPYFPAWSADGSLLYVPTQGPDAIVVLDAVTGAELGSRTFDEASCILPHEVVVSADGSALHIVCEGDKTAPGSVLTLDAATLETSATMPVGVYPDRLAIRGPT